MSGSLKKSALSESKNVSTEIVRSRSTCKKEPTKKHERREKKRFWLLTITYNFLRLDERGGD